MTDALRIGVWGDSILLGVVLDEIAGRYRVLKNNAVSLCANALKAQVDNFSKFGCTVIKGKERLLKLLAKGARYDVAVLEYGCNDCDLNWERIAADPDCVHEPNVPLDTFTANIQEMINTLRSTGTTPVLTTLHPLEPQRYFEWVSRKGLCKENIMKYLGDVHYIYRHQERYSLAVTELALKNNCHLIDIRSAFLARRDYADLICSDGAHPTEEGQKLIRETFVAYADSHLS